MRSFRRPAIAVIAFAVASGVVTAAGATAPPDRAPPGAEAGDSGGDLTPEWSLHIIDMNLVMGDLQHLVESQGAA